MTVRTDPKVGKPYRADSRAWATIREALLPDTCWVCGSERASELHHILARDGNGTWPRGDDATNNLAPVCGACHRLIEARDPWARSQLRGALTFSQVAYLVFRLGGKDRAEAFLERQYPMVAA